ncbi:MAG: type IV secretion system DNA-binding domain-containing protein [Armatimonadetes bacterium]|nr:type IV secretion system DNA-binding domain-containing protein [Armatimonadota bacterium]
MRSMGRPQLPEIPRHWVGIKKDWLDTCTSLGEALVSVPLDLLKTHAYAIGATGSGKTTAIHHFMSQDILERHSLVVLDMRGDLVNAALELCAGRVHPQKIKLFDLREKERPTGFNPLYGSGEPFIRALNVLDAIANESESFGVQLAETLRHSLILLAESQEPLTNLERLLTDARYRDSLLRGSQNVPQFWERYSELSPDKQAGYVAPVVNKVSLLFATEGLRRMLGSENPTDLGGHLNTPGTVTLISLAVDELHGAGRMMGSLFLSSICREIFGRVGIPERERVPVHLIVDEFENFSMKEFESIFAEGRRFGLSLFIANQTLAQLSTKMRSLILNNVGVKLYFRTGRDDAPTLSKDLTGDLKALDLSSLEVGEAMLWHRGIQPTLIEINAPLFANTGKASKAAIELRKILRDMNPQPLRVETRPEAGPVRAEFKSDETLGDWL